MRYARDLLTSLPLNIKLRLWIKRANFLNKHRFFGLHMWVTLKTHPNYYRSSNRMEFIVESLRPLITIHRKNDRKISALQFHHFKYGSSKHSIEIWKMPLANGQYVGSWKSEWDNRHCWAKKNVCLTNKRLKHERIQTVVVWDNFTAFDAKTSNTSIRIYQSCIFQLTLFNCVFFQWKMATVPSMLGEKKQEDNENITSNMKWNETKRRDDNFKSVDGDRESEQSTTNWQYDCFFCTHIRSTPSSFNSFHMQSCASFDHFSYFLFVDLLLLLLLLLFGVHLWYCNEFYCQGQILSLRWT